jgi:Pilus formation protein N terminal region
MTDVGVQGRMRPRLACWLAAAFLAVAAAPAFGTEPIAVPLDSAQIIKLPERAATVVIGNPLVADLSLQPGGLAVITGKGYGATNVIVLDKQGAVLAEHTVEVKGPSDPIVVVYRGVTRQTYSCTPDCHRRATLGDTGVDYFTDGVDKDYFAKTLEQVTSRNTQALAVGTAQGPQQGH